MCKIEDIYIDEFTFKTSGGTCCYHHINSTKTLELLERLKNSKYFKGKRKIKFEDEYNDVDKAIKEYEKRKETNEYQQP